MKYRFLDKKVTEREKSCGCIPAFVSTFMAKIGELLLMEIRLFKYVSDEKEVKKPSSPKQLEVRVRSNRSLHSHSLLKWFS